MNWDPSPSTQTTQIIQQNLCNLCTRWLFISTPAFSSDSAKSSSEAENLGGAAQKAQNLWHYEITMKHLTMEELEAALDHLRQSPKDEGVVQLIVRRPKVDEREVIDEGELDPAGGLIGDSWSLRGSRRTADGSPHPDMQINIMNARVTALVAQEKERWALAGDQLYIDMDLSKENLPAGSRIAIGSAVLEVSPFPHTGCHKFVARFGLDAMKFVNSEVGKQLCLRGINAKVIQGGVVKVGQSAKKV